MNHRFLHWPHALTATLALFTSVPTLSCSSEGSSFGTGGATGSTTGGTGNSNTTNANGGSGTVNGGSGNVNGGTGNVNGGTGNVNGGTGNVNGGNTAQGGTGGTGVDPGPPCLKAPTEQYPTPVCHEFIANDNANNRVIYVNEFGTKPDGVEWSTPVNVGGNNSPRTIEVVDNAKSSNGKAVLVSLNNGYGEFDLGTGEKLDQAIVNFSGITGAARLPDGNTALAADTKMRVVSPNGTEIPALGFNLPTGGELRAINRHPTTGDFWFSRTEKLYQVNKQGIQVWDANMGAGTKGYAVWWREGGGAYGTTGEPATIVEIDKDKAIVNTVGGRTKFPYLDFFSGFDIGPTGNYMVANWLGHLDDPGAAADVPHVVEITPANEQIWQWGNQKLARQITNVYLIR